MPTSPARQILRPKLIFFVMLSLTLILLGGMLYQHQQHQKHTRHSALLIANSTELAWKARYYDEALTMSLQMAIASDDVIWKTRYMDFVEKLDQTLAAFDVMLPTEISNRFKQSTVNANLKLYDLENRIIRHLDAKEIEKARTIIESSAYKIQKKAYIEGTERLVADVHKMVANQIARSAENWRIFQFAVYSGIAMLIFGWIFLYRVQRRMTRTIETWNRDLEEQVATRTAELGETVRDLNAVMDAIDYGVVFMGPDLRARVINKAFSTIWNMGEDFVKAGPTMADLMRYNQNSGIYKFSGSDFEAYVAERVAKAKQGTIEPVEMQLNDSRVLIYQCIALPDGGRLLTYFDITKHRQIEQELAEKENQLRIALENIPGGLAYTDANLNIVVCNDGYTRYFNLPSEMFQPGRSYVDVIRLMADKHAFGAGEKEALIQQRIENLKSPNGEAFLDHTPDGRYQEVRRNPVDGGGAVTIITDVTERILAEQEIKKSRKILGNILRNVGQAVVLFDQDQKLVTWNKRFPETLDLDESLLVPGMHMFDIALILASRGQFGTISQDTDVVKIAQDRVNELCRGNARLDVAYGDERIYDCQSIQTPDEQLVVTYTDITERKKSQEIIESSMKFIHESITYASRIQRSVLPTELELQNAFNDYFLIWEPKDVVGGDICLLRSTSAGTLLALVDCTGHGVPGALMTMVVTGALDLAVSETAIDDPGAVLTRVHQIVKSVLGQTSLDSPSNDGFECGFCFISKDKSMLKYSGSRFELWQCRDGEISKTSGDKKGAGYCETSYEQIYQTHIISIQAGDTFYMSSDGLIDQIGGERRRGFGKKRLKNILVQNSHHPMNEQEKMVLSEFGRYQGRETRRDDLSCVGFRLD